MEISAIAKKYSFNESQFLNWLQENGYPIAKGGLFKGAELSDSAVDEAVRTYQALKDATAKRRAEEKAAAEAEEAKKQAAMAQMLITSGFSFDGYTIKKYSGYISGDDVIQISRGKEGIFSSAADVGSALSESLVKIRRNALKELKEAAYALGCNAVVGVDFDYITLDPETASSSGGTIYLPYVFCVTANGNAVVIEKNE